jgi:peptidoglycan/xylan/chitin deacetylase (PgdA/CDA1 family)
MTNQPQRPAWAVCGFATGLLTLTTAAAGESAVGQVERFYDALAAHRCDEAAQLWPGFPVSRCRAIESVGELRVLALSKNDRLAVVQVDLAYREGGVQRRSRTDLTLRAEGGHWQILGEAPATTEQRQPAQGSEATPPARSSGTVPADAIAAPRPEDAPGRAPAQVVGSLPTGAESIPAPAAQSQPASPPQPDLRLASAPRPGATTLLEACWSPQDLRGRPGERKIRDHLTPDHRPPVRPMPLAPLPLLPPDAARSLRSVDPFDGQKLVALTFDLCEQAGEVTGYDGELVDGLRAEGAKATFYAGGKWMQSHPERAMQLMADPLFELGNHAWTHGNLRLLQGREVAEQVLWTQAEYERLRDRLLTLPCAAPFTAHDSGRIAPAPATFRFPYGTCNADSLRAVAAAGLYPVQWSIVTGDPAKGQTAAQIVKTVLAQVRPGAIVVAHGNGRGWHTAEAMKTLIPALRQQGYRLVTVSELLRSGTHLTVEQCYEVHAGDNLRYDKLFGKGTQ